MLAVTGRDWIAGLAPAMERTVAPASPLMTLHEARVHLRIEPDEDAETPDDPMVQRLIAAVTGELDGWGSWFGHALRPQTWRLSLSRPPTGPLLLPVPPFREVVAVSYVSALNGTRTTVADTVYRTVKRADSPFTELRLAPGQTWAAPHASWLGEPGTWSVEFSAGYDEPEGEALPDSKFELIRSYAFLRLGHLWEHREAMIAGSGVQFGEMPGFASMLENDRARHPYLTAERGVF